jgi:hypothetical protein
MIYSTRRMTRSHRHLQRRVIAWTWGIGLSVAALMLLANYLWGWRP